jgi:rubrerythrin
VVIPVKGALMQKVVDIVKHAIENEVKAKVFYEEAAQLTVEGESQMVFLELVEMESGHARLLVNRFGTLLGNAGLDAEQFLGELEGRAAQDPAIRERDLITRGEMRPVIEFAIGMEATARDNYLDLGSRLTDVGLKALCDDLAHEEQKHFDMLSELRRSVDTPIDERPAL